MRSRLFVVALIAAALAVPACGGSTSPTAPGTPTTAVSLSTFTLSASDVSGGTALQGTATLSAAAPAGGTTVTISSNSGAATVPASITIAAGATSGAFPIATSAVSAQTDVTITATAGGVSRTASLRIGAITSGVALAALAISPSAVQGGIPTTGTITLAAAAPGGGQSVALSSNDSFATVPGSVLVAAGTTTASFTVTTRLPPGSRDITITSTAGGQSRTAALKVSPTAPPAPVVTNISVGSGAQGGTLTLTLTGSNFVDGWDLSVAVSGTGVTVSNVTVLSDTSMNVTLVISNNAALGARQVTVSTAGRTSGAVTFSIVLPSAAPVASADSYSATEDVALVVPAGGVLTNDTDVDGDALGAMVVSGPANGALALSANGSFTYTPNANFNGTDSFTYRANDGSANSNTATVTLTVAAVNDAPVAVANGGSTNEDTVLNGATVLANDTDVEGDSLTAVLAAGPSNGALTLNANGTYQYTPNANFNGSDSFTYRANDGTANSNIATVSVTVNPVNDAPVAVANSGSTNEDTVLNVPAGSGVLVNDTDVDADALTAVLVAGPSNGALALNANGSYQYTPAANFHGSDSFTYRASDATATSAVVTVTITVAQLFDDETVFDNVGSANITVPLGTRLIAVEVYGAEGSEGVGGKAGGRGGRIDATIEVDSAETLQVRVGGRNGTNGGGVGGIGGLGLHGGTGGGASDIRRDPSGSPQRLIVAAGGGGGGGMHTAGVPGAGGNGGGVAGQSGQDSAPGFRFGGSGATNSGPGAGGSGNHAADGATGVGATGGTGGTSLTLATRSGGGGGGGGGLFGGGGGEGGPVVGNGSGGGGGSSGVPSGITGVTVTRNDAGVRSGNGIVIIRY